MVYLYWLIDGSYCYLYNAVWVIHQCNLQTLITDNKSLLSNNYTMDLGIIQKLAKCIVRPPRASYHIEDLVPPCFEMKSKLYQRHDFTVLNNRGLKIQGSYIKDRYESIPRETIIFLHANGSSRIIMKNYLDVFLPHYDLASFDFAGCGLSEGQYITLGYNEREDVYSVINHLRTEYKIKNIILWGRSMGAATALLYTAKYAGINAVISDNSYSDLEVLINELSDDYLPFLPSFLLNSIIDSIQSYIEGELWKKESTDFNLRRLKPITLIEKIECPVFYIGSLDDTFVNVKHTQYLYNKTKANKHLQLVKGNHNDVRTKELKDKVFAFLSKELQTKSKIKEKGNSYANLGYEKQKSQNSYGYKQHSNTNIPSPLQVQLVNCAQIQYEHHNRYKPKPTKQQPALKQQLSKSFLPQPTVSNTRQSLLNRYNKVESRVVQRSRSKLKRKKIFEGIEYINQHLNGTEY